MMRAWAAAAGGGRERVDSHGGRRPSTGPSFRGKRKARRSSWRQQLASGRPESTGRSTTSSEAVAAVVYRGREKGCLDPEKQERNGGRGVRGAGGIIEGGRTPAGIAYRTQELSSLEPSPPLIKIGRASCRERVYVLV